MSRPNKVLNLTWGRILVHHRRLPQGNRRPPLIPLAEFRRRFKQSGSIKRQIHAPGESIFFDIQINLAGETYLIGPGADSTRIACVPPNSAQATAPIATALATASVRG